MLPTRRPDEAGASEPTPCPQPDADDNGEDANGEEEVVETVGEGDALEEVPERMARPRRQYKIQEVIKRRQIMLVQVVKEERGTKGAALTTYLSLAGRYSVLMPNTARGGGISRKITSADDRKRLKEIAEELEVPEGMGVILRTAGANRTKTEVKRDFEYLLRLWETVRDLTLKSTAPTLVYEEGSLIKRSIRDLYNKDIDEIIVEGEDGYREAKDFMRMLMPSHAKNVKLYKRQPADLHALRHREPARRDVLADRAAQVRRLHRHQPDRGAGRDRRQFRPRDARASDRGHRAQDQSRGRRRNRAATAAARPCRPDRHRLHRHGGEAQQPRGRAPAEGCAEERPRPHPGRPHLAFRPAGNVAPAHPHLACWKARPRTARIAAAPVMCARSRRWRCSSCARSRKRCSRARPTISSCARARRSRSMCSTTSARICARSKSASSITITINADPTIDRPAAFRDRSRRAGDDARAGQGPGGAARQRWRRNCTRRNR